MKKRIAVLLFALSVALLGALVGAAAAGFLHWIEWGQELIWDDLAPHLPLAALLLCTLGGLWVGLCQRFLGDHPLNINEAVAMLRKTGRLDYRHLPHGLATVSASLIFGASLGPESAIMDLIGGLGTWVGDQIRAGRTRLGLPDPAQTAGRRARYAQRWPDLIAWLAGVIVFIRLLGGMYGGGFLHMSESFRWTDLLWSLPIGLIGAAAGGLFLGLQSWSKKLLAPLEGRPVIRGTLGGFTLGLLALWLPLMLFSGQHQLQQVYDQAAQLGFWSLFAIGLSRLVIINLLLASGWKGGQFLPLMFASAALGLSVAALFPLVSAPAAVLGTMAALLAIVLPRPVFALVLMALMFPLQYVGISAVAVGVVIAGQALWRRRRKPQGALAAQAGPSSLADS